MERPRCSDADSVRPDEDEDDEEGGDAPSAAAAPAPTASAPVAAKTSTIRGAYVYVCCLSLSSFLLLVAAAHATGRSAASNLSGDMGYPLPDPLDDMPIDTVGCFALWSAFRPHHLLLRQGDVYSAFVPLWIPCVLVGLCRLRTHFYRALHGGWQRIHCGICRYGERDWLADGGA